MKQWYFLDDEDSAGAVNMAVDEYLLDHYDDRGDSPVLRLYSFDPPAISVGFHQVPGEVLDLEAVKSAGLDLVRRITGGRALLHDGELTYSVTAPLDSVFFPSGLQETFISISNAIVDALKILGIDAMISGGKAFKGGKDTVSPCLVSTSRHEITAGGRKIVGSAQRRRSGSFLQHGSILLRPGSERIVDYLRGDFPPLSGLVTNIEAETGMHLTRDDLAGAMVSAFQQNFDMLVEPLIFSSEDLQTISGMTEKKVLESLALTGKGVEKG
ncbi:MAG: lipoate--protein ligase family protein [Candidatus Krumholzibacteriota bacterium]|nr:lipoate--protein ligase family protein [Candidatus Krumholzibacteriota bacterium]